MKKKNANAVLIQMRVFIFFYFPLIVRQILNQNSVIKIVLQLTFQQMKKIYNNIIRMNQIILIILIIIVVRQHTLVQNYQQIINHHRQLQLYNKNIIIIHGLATVCPQGCVYCQGPQAECILYWFNFAKCWQNNMDSDGWKIDNNIELKPSSYHNINLVGGYNYLKENQKLEKMFQNMPPHFQIQVQFKLWTLVQFYDSFNADYIINLDQQQYNSTQKFIKANSDVEILSIDIQMPHSSTDSKFKIQSSSKNLFNWALNIFDLYIAKCIIYCQKCVGPSIQDCTVCIDGWINYKGVCMPAPLILSQIMIKLKPKVQNQNQSFPFHIKIDENKQDVYNIGQNKVEIEQQFGNITFTIQANCFQKEVIESIFKSCFQCQIQQQYKLQQQIKFYYLSSQLFIRS